MENADGGWGYSPAGPSDANSTAVVIGALADAEVTVPEPPEGRGSPPTTPSGSSRCPATTARTRVPSPITPDKKGELVANADATAAAVLGMSGQSLAGSRQDDADSPAKCEKPGADPRAVGDQRRCVARRVHGEGRAPDLRASRRQAPARLHGNTADAIVALSSPRPARPGREAAALAGDPRQVMGRAGRSGRLRAARLRRDSPRKGADVHDFGGQNLVTLLNATGPTPADIEEPVTAGPEEKTASDDNDGSLNVAWTVGGAASPSPSPSPVSSWSPATASADGNSDPPPLPRPPSSPPSCSPSPPTPLPRRPVTRYWSFWDRTGTHWTYATQGPSTARPADGDIQGFRFAVSEDSADAKPRARPPTSRPSAPTPRPWKGKSASPSSSTSVRRPTPRPTKPHPPPAPPAPTVSPDATTAEALASVAKPLRYDTNALLCAIGGYPEQGCGEQITAEHHDGPSVGILTGATAIAPPGSGSGLANPQAQTCLAATPSRGAGNCATSHDGAAPAKRQTAAIPPAPPTPPTSPTPAPGGPGPWASPPPPPAPPTPSSSPS
ncbi:SCO2322 family protein [Streptomyces sp. L7]